MNPEEFDQKLTEKIKEAKIAPKPRWHFLLKDYVVWVAGALALLIGAAAVSVMIYLLKNNGWELREETHKSVIEFFLLTLPYFWIIFLGIFVFILYYNLKHTKKGYRYPVWLIALAGVLSSIILGSIFFLFGLGQRIDNVLGQSAPLYEIVMNRQLSFWFNPEEGRLAGIIISEVDDGNFYLVDSAGDDWQVLGRNSGSDSRSPDFLKAGEPINLIGQILEDKKFRADIIRPLVPGRGFFTRPKIRQNRAHCFDDICLPPLPPSANMIPGNLIPENPPPGNPVR
ncbi:MAG: hypothetical protein NTY31_01190 [Candidatus Falkowbacteria bacterium]|nr:hypothetical protein [Candidatus Falkowbacteria bacterium]